MGLVMRRHNTFDARRRFITAAFPPRLLSRLARKVPQSARPSHGGFARHAPIMGLGRGRFAGHVFGVGDRTFLFSRRKSGRRRGRQHSGERMRRMRSVRQVGRRRRRHRRRMRHRRRRQRWLWRRRFRLMPGFCGFAAGFGGFTSGFARAAPENAPPFSFGLRMQPRRCGGPFGGGGFRGWQWRARWRGKRGGSGRLRRNGWLVRSSGSLACSDFRRRFFCCFNVHHRVRLRRHHRHGRG